MLTYFFGVSGGGGASLRGMLMAVGGGGGRSSKVVVSSGDFSNSARGAVSSGSGETEFGRESMATHGSVLETHKKLHESTATLTRESWSGSTHKDVRTGRRRGGY